MGRSDPWLNARTLYRDLAIPGFYMSFEDWFTSRVQGEFKEIEDWKVEIDDDELHFWITQETADQIAHDEIGLPVERAKTWSHEVAEQGWNQENNPQTHAITGDEDL